MNTLFQSLQEWAEAVKSWGYSNNELALFGFLGILLLGFFCFLLNRKTTLLIGSNELGKVSLAKKTLYKILVQSCLNLCPTPVQLKLKIKGNKIAVCVFLPTDTETQFASLAEQVQSAIRKTLTPIVGIENICSIDVIFKGLCKKQSL